MTGALEATFASPRVTLNPAGDVVAEERLTAAGAIEVRKQFAGGKLVTEEYFAADGKLDEGIAYRYDASGRLAEEARTPRHVGPPPRAPGRLIGRDFVKADGKTEATETYAYAADGKSATMVRAHVDQLAIDYAYDAHHRLISEVARDASCGVRREVRIAY